jgi:hypothetical protein
MLQQQDYVRGFFYAAVFYIFVRKIMETYTQSVGRAKTKKHLINKTQ